MNTAWCLFEIGINIFQAWLYCYFINSRMTLKSGINKTKHRIANGVLIGAVALFYSLYIWVDIPVSDFAAWGLTLLYSAMMFSERWYVKVAWNICLAVLMLCSVNLSSALLIRFTGATWDMIMQPSILRVVYVLSCNLMALIVIYLVAKMKPKQQAIHWSAISVFIVMNAALVLGLEMQYQLSVANIGFEYQLMVTMIALIFVSACTVALFELLSSKTERAIVLEAELENTRMIKLYNEELEAMYKKRMEYQHDMKNQFIILEEMIARGETEESRRYLKQLKDRVLPMPYRTGCVPVDAIVSVKAMHMQSEGISFEFEPYPLTELPIDTQDFCALLGNMLDNAVEAVARMDRPQMQQFVHLRFARIRDMLYITCRNSADVCRIKRRGDAILSSKRANRQGYGLSSIRRIVDKADGFFTFETEQDAVKVEIILPYGRME